MNSYGSLAHFYDALTEDVPYAQFTDWYCRQMDAHPRPIRTVLDLACGTGGLTIPLAARGYELIAVDGAPEMLAALTEKLAEAPPTVPPLVLCQQLPELDLYGTVDACVCCLDGMNYIPPQDLPELFRRLHLFLEPDGFLAFDFHSPAHLHALDGQTFVDETEDVLCLWRANFDEEENCLVYGMDIFRYEANMLWEREQEEHLEYAHSPELLLQLLEQAGFIHVCLHHDGPQAEMGRLFITAENTGH